MFAADLRKNSYFFFDVFGIMLSMHIMGMRFIIEFILLLIEECRNLCLFLSYLYLKNHRTHFKIFTILK